VLGSGEILLRVESREFAGIRITLVLVVLFSLFFLENKIARIVGRLNELYVMGISVSSMVSICFAPSFDVNLVCLGFQRTENKVAVALKRSFKFPLFLKKLYFTNAPLLCFLLSSFAQALATLYLAYSVFAVISSQNFLAPSFSR
jgi:hypothetical protein